MEDDEEIQSPPSSDTGSPVSTAQNERRAVTVAAAPPQNTMALALPIQQPRATGNGGGRDDFWSEGATSVLIDAWGERYLELSKGNLKQKDWKEVADIVNSREDTTKKTSKTDIQCKNRIDTVKKKYKVEKSKIAAGGGPSKWPFFERIDQLIGPTAKISSAAVAGKAAKTLNLPYKVPIGIPVGVRSVHQSQHQQKQLQQKQKQQQQLRRRTSIDPVSSRSESEPSPQDSTDSFPLETNEPKRRRIHRELNPNAGALRGGGDDGGGTEGRVKNWGNSVRELSRAILKFGEAYEQAENSKLEQLVEMEKQRMKFCKELELQRMQFFMKTQLELSQLKHRRVGNSNHHSNCNINNNKGNNNSDSSS
ncbi:hypothetical protein U1Q18_026796 [Sarracenia purpurea var. burkii]